MSGTAGMEVDSRWKQCALSVPALKMATAVRPTETRSAPSCSRVP